MKEGLRIVGTPFQRVDAMEKVTGKAAYGADLEAPGMVYGKALRAAYPHARIRGVDVSSAEKLPGVVAVATARDVPGKNALGLLADQPIICGERVRFYGDVVALVAAETPETAALACKLIKVDYEPLPPVTSPRSAVQPGVPELTPTGNIAGHVKVRKGNVEEGFAQSAVVVERTYVTPFIDHVHLDVEAALVVPGADGGYTVYGGSQSAFYAAKAAAGALGIPESRVRFIQVATGGGFGGRIDAMSDICSRAAVLAALCGRPVKMVYDRAESMIGHVKRHAAVMHYKTGASAGGKILAQEITLYLDKGAYASIGPYIGPAGGVVTMATAYATGPYEIPNVKVDGYSVYTNNPIGGAMRGFGLPQVSFASECQMDEVAAALGLDPLKIRRGNALKIGSRTATGQVITHSAGLVEAIDRVAERSDWEARRREAAEGRGAGTRKRGLGLACAWHPCGTSRATDHMGAHLYVNEEGRLVVAAGVSEMGQGARTVLAQIAAEELGLTMEDVVVNEPDTRVDAESGTTSGSRGTTIGGNAVIRAAREAREALLEKASEILSVHPSELEIREGLMAGRSGQGTIPFREVAKRLWAEGRRLIGHGWWKPPGISFDPETGNGNPSHVYEYVAQVAEVEVDEETGEVSLLRLTGASDVGRAINPTLVEGQIQGGMAMGVGFGMTEEVKLEGGKILNPGLTDYLIPSAQDVPPMETIIVESPNVHGPFGAKGSGEPPSNPTAAAIANAIYDATGVRIRELPASPEKVWRSLQGGIARVCPAAIG